MKTPLVTSLVFTEMRNTNPPKKLTVKGSLTGAFIKLKYLPIASLSERSFQISKEKKNHLHLRKFENY